MSLGPLPLASSLLIIVVSILGVVDGFFALRDASEALRSVCLLAFGNLDCSEKDFCRGMVRNRAHCRSRRWQACNSGGGRRQDKIENVEVEE